MGKADQKRAQNAITATTGRNLDNTNAGISEESSRVNNLTSRSDQERAAINQGYTDMANNKVTYGLNTAQPGATTNSGGGGGGASGATQAGPAEPDYLSVFKQLSGETGGFDPTRLGNINSVTDKLRNTSGNFGATDTSIQGLQDFAKTGGIRADTSAQINDPTLQEFSQTGGYNQGQIADIRSRANSAVPAFYQNMRDDMARKQAVSGGITPGLDRTQFKLARDQAQGAANTTRDTEIGIGDTVRQGRMAAGTQLANNALQRAGIESGNTLQGYGSAGNLDLSKQGQISQDLAASGNLDLGTQGTINQARLGAASGLSQDTLGRMSIGASSSSAAASRAQQESQWEQEMAQSDRYHGNAGLLDTYQASPTELLQNQDLLRGYRNDQMQAGQNEVGNRIGASQIPGLGSTISSGIGIAGQLAGIAGGGFGGLVGTGRQPTNPMRYTPGLIGGR